MINLLKILTYDKNVFIIWFVLSYHTYAEVDNIVDKLKNFDPVLELTVENSWVFNPNGE